MGASPKPPVKVLLLLPSLNGGGAERVALHVQRKADEKRFDVQIGLLRRAGHYLEQADPQRLISSPIGQKFLNFDQGNDKTYQPSKLLMASFLAPFNTWKMVCDTQPDIVVTFLKGMSICTMFSLLPYDRKKLRWVAREGNNTLAVIDDELKGWLPRAFIKSLTKRCYRSADRLLTIAQEMGDSLAQSFGIERESVPTIHNCVDLEEVSSRAQQEVSLPFKGPFIVAMGRLARQKGYDVLFRAFAKSSLRDSHHLLVLGEGEELASLEALIQELDLEGRIILHGFVDNPWAYLSRAAVFVLPSRWEGFANVVIEAMACETPVIVSDCHFGPKEIVEYGDCGLIVPVGDEVRLREALEEIVNDEGLAAKLVANAKRRVRDFSIESIVAKYEALFEDLASELQRKPVALTSSSEAVHSNPF